MILGQGSKGKSDKLYRGAYNYMRNNNIYAEETFEVYRDKTEMGLHFICQFHSRVATGELLTIITDYTIGKDFRPIKVVIDKSLGDTKIQESYAYNNRSNELTYTYTSDKEKEVVILLPPPKFHITVPTTSTSMLFLRSKKFDTSGKNYYQLYATNNLWKYEGPPKMQSVYMKKISQSNETHSIEGQKVTGNLYRFYQDVNEDLAGEFDGTIQPYLNVFISKYSTIPYYIESADDGTKVQVKYLNDLDA